MYFMQAITKSGKVAFSASLRSLGLAKARADRWRENGLSVKIIGPREGIVCLAPKKPRKLST